MIDEKLTLEFELLNNDQAKEKKKKKKLDSNIEQSPNLIQFECTFQRQLMIRSFIAVNYF